MTQYGMVIDLNRCFGCQTCAAACKVANNLPKELAYNVVHTVGGESTDNAGGAFPNCELSYLPMQCQHCSNPACTDVCPTGATEKDEETGIVTVDNELCIGCESCIKACPYSEPQHVRTLLSEEPQYYIDVVVGEADAPTHKFGTVEKCTFCKNLIDRGEVPACMDLCPGRARYWGDIDDPDSDVSKALEGREYSVLQENEGTNPSVFYIQ